MPRFVLDTPWYVDVLRDHPTADEIVRFIAAHGRDVHFHAIVGAELLSGTRTSYESMAVRQRVIDRFTPSRLLTPDAADIFAAGDALRSLRNRFGPHVEHESRSFWNDVLIAVTCRRRGAVLISRDRDHERIAQIVKHDVRTTLAAA